MPTYTMTLKRVSELNDGRIGLDSYPIFDESYRETLNEKIFDRFMNREIGQETDSLFVHAMKRKMNEIMPYYNQLYVSEQMELDPLNTVNITETHTTDTGVEGETSRDINTDTETSGTTSDSSTSNTDTEQQEKATNSSTSTSDNKSRAMSSATPQTRMSPDGDYADSMTDTYSDNSSKSDATDDRSGNTSESGTTTDDGTSTSESSSTEVGTTTNRSDTAETGERTKKGHDVAQVDLLMKLRQSFLNVDLQILDELEKLFMLTWFNDDYYTGPGVGYFGRMI